MLTQVASTNNQQQFRMPPSSYNPQIQNPLSQSLQCSTTNTNTSISPNSNQPYQGMQQDSSSSPGSPAHSPIQSPPSNTNSPTQFSTGATSPAALMTRMNSATLPYSRYEGKFRLFLSPIKLNFLCVMRFPRLT